jgi:hypothetical protein
MNAPLEHNHRSAVGMRPEMITLVAPEGERARVQQALSGNLPGIE